MDATTRWSIDFPSDLTVVGYDPENADLDAPNGEVIELRYSVRATNDEGYRWVWAWGFASAEEAESAYRSFASPVEFWNESRPMYGSRAYVVEDIGRLDAEQERAEALHPFPRW